jgi:hypothetical protein
MSAMFPRSTSSRTTCSSRCTTPYAFVLRRSGHALSTRNTSPELGGYSPLGRSTKVVGARLWLTDHVLDARRQEDAQNAMIAPSHGEQPVVNITASSSREPISRLAKACDRSPEAARSALVRLQASRVDPEARARLRRGPAFSREQVWDKLTSMSERFAEGANYSIVLEGKIAVCRVWSRPDLDSAAGAQLAMDKIALFQRLAAGVTLGLVFDLSQAPVVTGPKTQQALGAMMMAWQSAGKPAAIVSGPNSIQQLQLRRLISTFAPDHGALFGSVEEASAWLDSRLLPG